MTDVVLISGSPSFSSRSTFVARRVTASALALARAGGAGANTLLTVSPSDLDGNDLLLGRQSAAVTAIIEIIRGSRALVLATPAYKGAYTGALKAIVDVVPADALRERPVLGIATAKSSAHAEQVADLLDALFRFFEARPVAPTLALLEDEVPRDGDTYVPSATASLRIQSAALALGASLAAPPLLGRAH